MAVLFKDDRVKLLKVVKWRLRLLLKNSLQSQGEALTPERQVRDMVSGRPEIRRPTRREFGGRHLVEKGILVALSLVQEIKEHRLKRLMAHELFFLTAV